MARDNLETGHSRGLRRHWPWLVLALLLIPAVWHVVDFDEDIDPEFPKVTRLAFAGYLPRLIAWRSRVIPWIASCCTSRRRVSSWRRRGSFRPGRIALAGDLALAWLPSGIVRRQGQPLTAGTAWVGELSPIPTCASGCSLGAIRRSNRLERPRRVDTDSPKGSSCRVPGPLESERHSLALDHRLRFGNRTPVGNPRCRASWLLAALVHDRRAGRLRTRDLRSVVPVSRSFGRRWLVVSAGVTCWLAPWFRESG